MSRDEYVSVKKALEMLRATYSTRSNPSDLEGEGICGTGPVLRGQQRRILILPKHKEDRDAH